MYCLLISVVFTPSPPSHRGSIWLLPVISLLLINIESQVRRRGFVGPEKKTSVVLLVFNSL